jgi:exopolyphosphatase/guanosine-5'-triphosphate,3'-diphosphate pyrophosphatase
MMAQALSSNFGHDKLADVAVAGLCTPDRLRHAHIWGVAMRLGQRLSGGVGAVLERTALRLTDGEVQLVTSRKEQGLVTGIVSRRLSRLAQELGLRPVCATG